MTQYYSTTSLSQNIIETPEGFIVCLGVPIARSGQMVYLSGETPISPRAGQQSAVVYRLNRDIHDPATMASFEGKPVTLNHPDDFVNPLTWKQLSVGTIQNVRPGEGDQADKLLADLLINDAEAIGAIRSNTLREVSCGYEAEYIQVGEGVGRQEQIVGNHVALVEAGRCGPECAIFDHAPKTAQGDNMTKAQLKQKVLALVGKAMDEDPPTPPAEGSGDVDIASAIDALTKRMDAIETAIAEATAGPTDEEPAETAPEETAAGETQEGDPEAAAGDPPAADAPDDPTAQAPAPAPEGAPDDPLRTMVNEIVAGALKEKLAGEAGDAKPGKVTRLCTDSDTVSRAEIIAPGITKTVDVARRSVEQAYKTDDGARKIIDGYLNGRELKSVDPSMFFVALSEALAGERRTALGAGVVSIDQLPSLQADTSADDINKANEKRYGAPSS